ncbi:MAG: Ger(x)C family spore germination protein [Deltaproteobacteria bacterium]
MTKILNKLSCIWLFIMLLTGCWDFQDVNRRSITLSVGVDKIGDNIIYIGENAKLVPSTKNLEKSQAPDIYTFIAAGKYFEGARSFFEKSIPLPDFLGAARVVVFSTNFAKEGIEPYMNRIDRLFGYRKSLPVVVSRQTPDKLFQNNVKNNISVGFAIENTLDHLQREGTALYSKVVDILHNIALSETGYVLPYISKENETISLLGYAVMKDSKMIGIIDIKDSNGLLYLLADKPIITEPISHPGNKNNFISTRTSLKKRHIKTSYINNKLNINIKLDLETQIAYEYYIEPITDEDKKMIEQIIKQKTVNYIISTIIKSQKEYQTDIFNFAKYFRADNPKIFKEINWKQLYPNANINVDVKVKVTNLNFLDPNSKPKM